MAVDLLDRLRQTKRRAAKQRRLRTRRREQERALRALAPTAAKRVVVGSGETRFEGWFATDREVLDLLECFDAVASRTGDR